MTEDVLRENAAVLAGMAERGDDLAQARDVEFAHLFDDRNAAVAFCAWAEQHGYAATVEERDDASTDVVVRRRMVPDARAITELELALAAAARDLEGEPDGWGCFSVPKLHS